MSICFLGDVMCGRLTQNSDVIQEDISSFINSADVCIYNLECAITEHGSAIKKVIVKPKSYISKHSASLKQAQIIKTFKKSCCNLANNHILDYGFDGVKETISFLNNSGVKWFGFGKDHKTAWKPRLISLNMSLSGCNEKMKIKVAVFGMADHFIEWRATEHEPGINFFDITNANYENDGNPNRSLWSNLEHIKDNIDRVRGSVDLIVFSIHWGDNFQSSVDKYFKKFAFWLIDNGVNIIHGHSSHHIMPVEVYQGGVIIYGNGDFLNDYDIFEDALQDCGDSFGPNYDVYQSHLSFVYKIYLEAPSYGTVIISYIELCPIHINDGRVLKCSDEEKEVLITKMASFCKEVGIVLDTANTNARIQIC